MALQRQMRTEGAQAELEAKADILLNVMSPQLFKLQAAELICLCQNGELLVLVASCDAHLADPVQGAQEDLVQVAVVQQVCVLVDHMLHHGVHLQCIAPQSPSPMKADQHSFLNSLLGHSPVHL